MDARRALGGYGEELGARYLTFEHHTQVGERGEHARHRQLSCARREAVDAVGWDKAVRLRRLALAAARELVPDHCGLRVDVVGVLRPASGPAQVRHIRGIGS